MSTLSSLRDNASDISIEGTPLHIPPFVSSPMSAYEKVRAEDLANYSISELINMLRTTFLSSDFDRVEETLVARECKIKKENEELGRLLESKELCKLDTACIESELKELKEIHEKLKKEHSDHKEMLVKVYQSRNEAQEKEMLAQEKYSSLEEEVRKLQEENMHIAHELESKNKELEHPEIEIWRSNFIQLENRLLVLKETVAMLEKAENTQDPGEILTASPKTFKDHGADSQHQENEKLAFKEIVEIVDSDDECNTPRSPCRKEASSQLLTNNASETGFESQNKTQKRKRGSENILDAIAVSRVIRLYDCDSESSSSSSDDLLDLHGINQLLFNSHNRGERR